MIVPYSDAHEAMCKLWRVPCDPYNSVWVIDGNYYHPATQVHGPGDWVDADVNSYLEAGDCVVGYVVDTGELGIARWNGADWEVPESRLSLGRRVLNCMGRLFSISSSRQG